MIQEQSVAEYLEALASGSSTPGGGAAAALTLAQAAALVVMVCNFTYGKEKYADVKDQVFDIMDHAKGIQRLALRAVEDDAAAFKAVMQAYKLPGPIAGRDIRKEDAIQDALKRAATVPWNLVECCEKLYEKALDLRPICNPNLVSDVDVAICLLQSAIGALWINVDVNMRQIKDPNFGLGMRAKVLGAMKRIQPLQLDPFRALFD